MSRTVDLEIKKIDHLRKQKDGETVDVFKATLQNEFKDLKLVAKYDDKQGLEQLLGTLEVGLSVQIKISNDQTKLEDHGEED